MWLPLHNVTLLPMRDERLHRVVLQDEAVASHASRCRDTVARYET